MGRRPLVVGNWKMYGTLQSISKLLEGLKHGCKLIKIVELVVIPPYIFIPQCKEMLLGTEISWGAQDISEHEVGAYTGEISATMLRDFLCRYVIIGHSERRKHGETNESVARKVKRALNNGILPIICVGETEAQRKSGETLKIVQEQLAVVLRMHDNHDRASLSNIVIAYEPIWAIGTDKNASPVQAEEVHAAIREQLRHYDATIAINTRILYGGSVTPENVRSLFKMVNIDGVLVGGASLQVEDFLKIGEQCNRLY